jgi:hypothetical protein
MLNFDIFYTLISSVMELTFDFLNRDRFTSNVMTGNDQKSVRYQSESFIFS